MCKPVHSVLIISILETLKMEGKVMHGLHELGIKEEALSKLRNLDIHPANDSYALDIRHSSITVSKQLMA